MGEEVTVRLTMPDEKIYEIKVNQNIVFEDALVKLIHETKIMEHKNANDNLILASKQTVQTVVGPNRFKESIAQCVEKTSEGLILKLKTFIVDVNDKDYYKVEYYFINLGNIKTQNEQSISKNMIQDPNSIKNFQHVEPRDNKKKVNMMKEIEIHLEGIGNSRNKSHSIKINPNSTVSDLINKIKLDKNIVGNNEYLYLAPGNHDNVPLSEKKSMNLKISDFGIQNGSKLDFDFFDSDSDDDNKSYRKHLINLKREEQDDLINENSQQPKKNVKAIFDSLKEDKIEVEISSKITFNDLVEKFKTQALEKDKYYFKGIDKISFAYNNTLIKTSSSNTSLSSITKSAKDSITIRVIDGGFDGFGWNVSNINNDINNGSKKKRILFFVAGTLLLIAALVVFLVNPELLATIIILGGFGGISLLVGFLWNTIKSCLVGSESEKISIEPLTETNEYDPNKTTNLSNLNNNLLLEISTQNKSKQEQQ